MTRFLHSFDYFNSFFPPEKCCSLFLIYMLWKGMEYILHKHALIFFIFLLVVYILISFPYFSKLKETGGQFKLPSSCLYFHFTYYMPHY